MTNRVRRIAGGRVYTVAGGAGKLVPDQIAFDGAGNLYITEPSKNRVWKRAPDWKMTIIAGSPTGTAGYSGDGGPGNAAKLRAPSGVTATPNGYVYIADEGNHRVRRVDPDGRIRHWLGNGADVVVPAVFDGTSAEFALLPRPQGITWVKGHLYVQSGARVISVSPDRLHVTYVGFPGSIGNSGDGKPAGTLASATTCCSRCRALGSSCSTSTQTGCVKSPPRGPPHPDLAGGGQVSWWRLYVMVPLG